MTSLHWRRRRGRGRGGHFKKWRGGGTSGFVPPHFWTEHFFLISLFAHNLWFEMQFFKIFSPPPPSPSVLTYHDALMLLRFCYNLFFFWFSLFWKKLWPPPPPPPFRRRATSLSLYTFLLWNISKHTYLPEGYWMMVWFWILLLIF